MANERTQMRAPWGDIAPGLTEISDSVLFDDVWRRPGLSPRDRSLITVASLIALYRSNELPFHLGKALENGVTRDEIIEMITHLDRAGTHTIERSTECRRVNSAAAAFKSRPSV